jgi:hypothetical protein
MALFAGLSANTAQASDAAQQPAPRWITPFDVDALFVAD